MILKFNQNIVFYSDNVVQSLTKLDKFESDMEKTTAMMSSFSDRYMKTEYNIKQVLNTVHETEDKSDKLEKEFVICKEIVEKTAQNLVDLKEQLKLQRRYNAISNIRGHLIWKISNYSRKLNEAKENEIPLKSPLFSNKHFG
jgi:TNF receptor-associated factor 3